jgi:Dolichyl-phosphate-mannose-protein mannosyltransferase
VKAVRALTLALAAYFVIILFYVIFSRISFPYDLEWMEGGMLTHSLRLVEHQPIFAPPSVDFIPYLYTPGYPALVYWLSKLFGLGYGLGRAVSLLSYVATIVLVYVYARREGGSRAVAAVALAIPCAAFVPCGAWYDLARPDSLFLLLVTAGLLVGWWRRESIDGGIIAALLLVAAFFVKQTAAPFMVALGLALLLTAPRTAIAYGVTLAVVGLPSLWLSNRGSDGWFWTYTSVLHRKHGFFAARAFLGTPGRLFLLIGPGLLLVPWAIWRRRSPGLLYATFIACAGIGAAGLSFGTQWAYLNAFIPGIVLPAIAIGVAAGRLLDERPQSHAHPQATPPRLRPVVVWTLLAATILCAPGGLDPLFGRILPKSWKADSLLVHPTGYDPRPEIPTARDRAAGDALIARMRATPGDILIPFHPFYGYLAGKPTFLHRMGVLDTWRAGMGTPARLEQSLMSSRFAAVIMDDKIEGNWQMWPGLLARYRVAERIVGPDVVTGAPTTPRFWLVPNVPTPAPPPAAPAMIDRELQ